MICLKEKPQEKEKYFLYNFKYVWRELSSMNITILFDLE